MCYQDKDYNSGDSQAKVLNGLVMNYALLKNLSSPNVLNGIKKNDTITGAIAYLMLMVFVAFIHVAILFPLVAIDFALLIRIPLLWLTMAFMPFAVLSYILPGSIGGLELPTKKIIDTFVTSVFLPAMIAIPFTVGFVLIRAGMATDPPPIFGDLKKWGFPLINGLDTFWQFTWLFVALAVIWGGVFMVLKKQTIGAGITNTIQNTGQSIGKFVAEAPLTLPWIPTGGGGASPMGLARGAMREIESVNYSGTLRTEGFRDLFTKKTDEATKQTDVSQRVTTINNAAPNNIVNNVAINEILKETDPVKQTKLVREVLEKWKSHADAQKAGLANADPADVMRGIGNSFKLNADQMKKLLKAVEDAKKAP
jgi:hypothetical protein